MKDRYRTLMRRSFKDAFSVAQTVEEEYEITIPAEAYPSMALNLYQHRVQEYRKQVAEAEQASRFPNSDPGIGRQ